MHPLVVKNSLRADIPLPFIRTPLCEQLRYPNSTFIISHIVRSLIILSHISSGALSFSIPHIVRSLIIFYPAYRPQPYHSLSHISSAALSFSIPHIARSLIIFYPSYYLRSLIIRYSSYHPHPYHSLPHICVNILIQAF